MTRGAAIRPRLVYVDDELYGDFKTETDREKAVPGARESGEEVLLSQWKTDGYHGPGWSEPRSEPEHEQGEKQAELRPAEAIRLSAMQNQSERKWEQWISST